jgi:hypothetical protein
MGWFRRFPFGEAALWLLSIFFIVATAGDGDVPDSAFLAGTCVLAAIGVRATRQPREQQNDGR